MRTTTFTLAALAIAALSSLAHADGTLATATKVGAVTATESAPVLSDQGLDAEEQQQQAIQDQQKAVRDQQKAMKEQQQAMLEKQKVIHIMGSGKPRLGVILETEADEDTDAIGARIQAVTPGGPADQAGIKADDIIVKFNGKVLAGPNPDADSDESAPAIRLLSLSKDLKDGEKISVELRRGKDTKTVTLVPRILKEKDIRVVVDLPDLSGLKELKELDIPDLPEHFDFSFNLPGSILDMELVALNPELGEYFGTSEGLLVVRAPADSPLKLRGGDVLLKIGDRTPTSPSQALRILRSYEPKETIVLQVLRKHQKQTLNATVPEKQEWNWKGGRRSSEVPEPPSPPQAPKTPRPSEAPVAPAPPAGKT